MMKNDPHKLNRMTKFAVYGALFMLSIPAILPLLWMVSTSFKGNEQLFTSQGITFKSFIPSPVVVGNYPEALQNMPFLLYLRNTLVQVS